MVYKTTYLLCMLLCLLRQENNSLTLLIEVLSGNGKHELDPVLLIDLRR